jgi:hypothetical protein
MRSIHDCAHECLKEVTGVDTVNFRKSSSPLVMPGKEVVREGGGKIEPKYTGYEAKARLTPLESICGYEAQGFSSS